MKDIKLKPPAIAGWILQRIAMYDEDFSVNGDFDEEFYEIARDRGKVRAHFWYWRHVLFSLPFFIGDVIYWRFIMFRNYIKTAMRHFLRKKTFSFINVAGLAIGMSVSILIFLYVWNELSYDRCHEKSRNVFRIATSLELPQRQMKIASVPGPLGPALMEAQPDVVGYTRLRAEGNQIVSYKEKLFEEDDFFYAEPSVMDVFTIDVLLGDPESFLDAPFSLVLTEELADKYFGSENPLGKMVKTQNTHDFTVTGVVRKMPENSHFKFNFLASLSTLDRIGHPFERPDSWMGFNFHTYIELTENASPKEIGEKATAVVLENTAAMTEQLGIKISQYLQPMRDIHLHSRLDGELEPSGNPAMIRIFATIAVFILLIACINFMNLSTAQSTQRAREVGMRKVCGAHRGRLILQFLSESIFLCLISMLIAVVLIILLLPIFNGLIAKELTYHPLHDWHVTLSLLSLACFVGVFSGIYPAFFLSSYVPVEVLKAHNKAGNGHKAFRNVLVHLQYIISIALIFSTLVITVQLRYVKHQDLGFDKEHVAVIPLSGRAAEKYDVFKSEAIRIPGVEKASCSLNVPGWGRSETMFTFEGSENTEPRGLPFCEVDQDFVETMSMAVVSGRNFSEEYPGDRTGSILVNETLVKAAGWEDGLGKQVIMTDVKEGGEFFHVPYTVVGVVRDFHFESLHAPIRPYLMRMINNRQELIGGTPGRLSVRIRTGQIQDTLERLRAIWREIEPARPFTYRFLDDVFDRHYRTEQRLAKIFLGFTGMAIFIACLGLFGLASFTAEQRTKEIGIRKVLGASVSSVVVMLSREFTKWVLLANIVAWPVAYYAMFAWLRQFAYRTTIGVWMFLLSGLTALLIALLTVSFQAIRAAYTNPVNTLRYE